MVLVGSYAKWTYEDIGSVHYCPYGVFMFAFVWLIAVYVSSLCVCNYVTAKIDMDAWCNAQNKNDRTHLTKADFLQSMQEKENPLGLEGKVQIV